MTPLVATRSEWRTGWRNLAAAIIGMASGVSLQYYLASLFISHYQAEFGWERAEIAKSSIVMLFSGMLGPVLGTVMDRFGAKSTYFVCLIAYCLSCVGMANLGGNIWEFYFVYFLMVTFGIGTSVLMWSRVISGAFFAARGLALSVGMASITFSAMATPPLLQVVIADHGWRAGWLLLGTIGLVFGLLAFVFLLRMTGEVHGQTKSGTRHWHLLREKDFWLPILGMFIINVPSGAVVNQLAAMIEAQGLSPSAVAFNMSAFALSVFIGRFVTGFCLDRLPSRFVSAVVFAVPAVGCLAIAGADGTSAWLVTLGVLIVGFSQGSEGDVGPFVMAERFGLDALGTLMGGIVLATSVGVAVGATMFGEIYDRTGSYDPGFYIGAGCFVLGGLCYLLVTPRRGASPAAG